MRNRTICVAIGVLLAAVAAFMLGYSWLLATVWGAFSGALASLALEQGRPKANRVLYAALSLAVALAAIWVFATNGGA